MKPVRAPFVSQIAFGLCNLVCMVWKNIIYSATVNIHILTQMFDSDAGALNMPSRISNTPWAVPLQCLILEFGFCKPENKIVFIPFIFIFLHIVTHADLQLFLFDCGRKYKIILQSAGIKINISTGLISISLLRSTSIM